MAFKSIRPALRYIALLRSYSGQSSMGGEVLYSDPVMIRCYPSVENKFVLTEAGGAMVSKSILYVAADVAVKEQDIIILENAGPNWLGKNFASRSERDAYYSARPERLVPYKTWCCVEEKAQYWDGFQWSVTFDGVKIDGETVNRFQGKADTVKGVPKYFDGFGWDEDAESDDGLSIQEIAL